MISNAQLIDPGHHMVFSWDTLGHGALSWALVVITKKKGELIDHCSHGCRQAMAQRQPDSQTVECGFGDGVIDMEVDRI